MAQITILTPCFNEEDNIQELYQQIRLQTEKIPQHKFVHLFIDNASTDSTQKIIRELATKDPSVRAIFNNKNFGHIRSPVHGLLEADGEAVIILASDLQDPPDMIPKLVSEWEKGISVVMAVRTNSKEALFFRLIRNLFYWIIGSLSETKLVKNFTGSGLYDRKAIEAIRKIDDPYPYFRGLVVDLGFPSSIVSFVQPERIRGFSKNNFFSLYDMAMLGIINHSRVPLRLATILGFSLSGLSLLIAFIYTILKLIYWDDFIAGIAPLLIAVLIFSSVQLFFIGILGEYLGTVLTQVQKRPLVIERERVNWS